VDLPHRDLERRRPSAIVNTERRILIGPFTYRLLILLPKQKCKAPVNTVLQKRRY